MNLQFTIFKQAVLIIVLILALFFLWHQPVIAPSDLSDLPLADETPATPTTTLLFVGDIMLSRNVGSQIEKGYNPFANLSEILRGADITFGNLECPLSESPVPGGQGLVFRCPSKYIPLMKEAGFDVLSTANNHSFDQGLDDLLYTIDFLKENNIQPSGTKQNSDDLPLAVIEKNGIAFGFLSYSYTAFNDGGKSQHPNIATTHDLDELKNDIIRTKGHFADAVIVSMHAGTEYVRNPNQQQTDFARAAIDAGADVVIGHHPHWIQTIELYSPPQAWGGAGGEVENNSDRAGIIFYSLGNFVFDQMWSQDTREGLVIKLNIKNQKLKSAELMPVIIDNYCCPRLANEEEKENILKKINRENNIIRFDSLVD